MGDKTHVYIVRTGLANLASVCAGFKRVGAEPHITEDPADIEKATHVMLPGVGNFGPAMEQLNECGLSEVLTSRMKAGRPTMCICVGLQVLCETSDESPKAKGLSILPVHVERIPSTVRVPQLGWNKVEASSDCKMLQSGYAYFANSYCLPEAPEGWNAAYTEHGKKFVAAVEKGAVLGTQFHPELSSDLGKELLKRWLANEDKGAA